VDEILVSTVVYVPPERAYEFLTDFPGYAKYSKHLEGVTKHGDGSPGTEYDIHLTWWKLSYTVRTRVTDADPLESIDWEVIEDLHAHGRWRVEDATGEVPEDREHASRVWLEIRFDADSAHSGMVDLPRFVSLGWVVKKVRPVVQREAERVVERVVADLEGERRPVDLEIHD
jgi:uncharacterized membrane protein